MPLSNSNNQKVPVKDPQVGFTFFFFPQDENFRCIQLILFNMSWTPEVPQPRVVALIISHLQAVHSFINIILNPNSNILQRGYTHAPIYHTFEAVIK